MLCPPLNSVKQERKHEGKIKDLKNIREKIKCQIILGIALHATTSTTKVKKWNFDVAYATEIFRPVCNAS